MPTLLSCFAMIATLERFSHPLALPTGACGMNLACTRECWKDRCLLALRVPLLRLLLCGTDPAALRSSDLQCWRPSMCCSTLCAWPAPPPSGCIEECVPPLLPHAVLAAINVLFHIVRLALGVTLEQAMDANWVIRPAVRCACCATTR